MRRIVTGVNAEGRSYVMSCEELKEGEPNLWFLDIDMVTKWAQAIDPETIPPGIEPPPGVTKVVVAPGAKHMHSGPGYDERGFHHTRTIDYFYVLEGDRFLDLDEESVALHPGDLVILQAGRHAWRSVGDTRFLAVISSIA